MDDEKVLYLGKYQFEELNDMLLDVLATEHAEPVDDNGFVSTAKIRIDIKEKDKDNRRVELSVSRNDYFTVGLEEILIDFLYHEYPDFKAVVDKRLGRVGA